MQILEAINIALEINTSGEIINCSKQILNKLRAYVHLYRHQAVETWLWKKEKKEKRKKN